MSITILMIGFIFGIAFYDAAIADKKQAIYNKKRMNAVENAGILHGKLTGGQYDPRIN